VDRTFLFEQISAEFRLFEDISEKWAGKWHEAPIQDRKTWGNLIRVLKERIQLYDDLVELDKRALEFVSTHVEFVASQGKEASDEEFKEHLRTGDQPKRMRAAGIKSAAIPD